MALRAVVGTRVSHVKHKGQTSPESQREAGEKYALAHDYQIVGYFEDLDISAGLYTPWERPDMKTWLTDKVDEWDVMILSKVDRIFRSMKDCSDFAHWAEKRNKVLIITDDGIELNFREDNADVMKIMMAKIFLMLAAMFGEMELRRIKSRIKDAHANLRTKNRWAGGQPPYGYMSVPHPEGGRTLAVDPVSSLAVQEAARLTLEGKSMWDIAVILTEKGFPTPSQHVVNMQTEDSKTKRKTPVAEHWSQSSIRKILTSPATMGLKMTGTSIKTRRLIRGEDGLPIRMADPLFDEMTWGLLQNELQSRTHAPKQPTSKAAPLLGIVFCGGCDCRLYRQQQTKGSKTYDYYRCTVLAGKPRCLGYTFNTPEVQAFLDEQIEYELQEIPVTRRVFEPGEDHTRELDMVVKAINDIREERDLGLYDYPGGDDEYKERIAALVAQRKVLAELPHRPDRWTEVATGESYAEAYKRMDEEQRRALLLAGGISLTLSPNDWRLYVPNDLRERATQFGETFDVTPEKVTA